jgi:hypothetical protein
MNILSIGFLIVFVTVIFGVFAYKKNKWKLFLEILAILSIAALVYLIFELRINLC